MEDLGQEDRASGNLCVHLDALVIIQGNIHKSMDLETSKDEVVLRVTETYF